MFEQPVPQVHITQKLGIHRKTINLWIKGISDHPVGLTGFIDDYLQAKKDKRAKRKLDGLLIERICRLREENRDCCGQKIKKYLKAEFGINLSVTTIYKVLAQRYILRSKWKKNQVRGPVPKASQPREVIQMDSLDFGYVFAFSGIDIFTKEALVGLYPSLTSVWKGEISLIKLSVNLNTLNYSKLMVGLNSKISLEKMSLDLPNASELPDPTGKTNKPT